MNTKIITAYFTHHGPVMAKRNNKWISLKSFNRSVISLKQSWLRTKANNFTEYKNVMKLKANTSNNTVYADDKGNIAYWHGNYIPVRNTKFNWTKPVDGTTSATEWKGLHKLEEMVHLYNPPNGWLQNCNSTPFSVAGEYSPKKANYPDYMAPDGENFRGINAVRILSEEKKYTLEKVIATGYDSYLAIFNILLPKLITAYDRSKEINDTIYGQLKEPMAILKAWDYYAREQSVATTLAVEWAQKLDPIIQKIYVVQGEKDQVSNTRNYADTVAEKPLLNALLMVVNNLNTKFGKWQIPWGELNRYQRINNDLTESFSDTLPSIPVGFTPSVWGEIPAYKSKYFAGNKKRYGVGGNSFICAVQFGKKIKAKSLLAGGQSGDVTNKHFKDQAEMYAHGDFKNILFYPEDLQKHVEKKYHPGE